MSVPKKTASWIGAAGAEDLLVGGAEVLPAGGAEVLPAGGAEVLPDSILTTESWIFCWRSAVIPMFWAASEASRGKDGGEKGGRRCVLVGGLYVWGRQRFELLGF